MTTTHATALLRPLHAPEDYPGMAAANTATRVSAGRPSGLTVEDLRGFLEHLVNCDPARDIVVVEVGGRIAGYSIVIWRDLVDGERVFVNWRILEPGARGRGIEARTLDWADERMTAIAAGLGAEAPTRAITFTWGDDAPGADVLRGRGWAEAARGYEMLRPTLDDLPDVPLPDGIEVRPVTLDDGPRMWDALVDGFRDHRNEPEQTDEDRERFLGGHRHDPGLWVLAFDGDEIAAGVVSVIDPEENAERGRQQGYVEAVFTRPAWRRRGLARALLARSLHALRERAMSEAVLSVDGANPNQAMTLYEDSGFVIGATETEWTRAVPAPEIPSQEAP